MLEQEVRELAVEWACLGEYYRTPLSDQVCGFYSRDLADLPLVQVIGAMRAMRMDPKRRQLPMPADVRDRIRPEHGMTAVDAAARITSAISKYGYTNPKQAQAYVGPVGWQVVEQMGGWDYLCQSLKTSEMGTFYAQARELCKGQLSKAESTQLVDGGTNLLNGRLTPLTTRC